MEKNHRASQSNNIKEPSLENNDGNSNDVKNNANEMKQNILDHINDSITLYPNQEPQISIISLYHVLRELNNYEEFLIQNNLNDNDLKSIKKKVEIGLIEGYKQDNMWSNVFAEYNGLKKNEEIKNQYMIDLNIGNIFISHGRYSKSFRNYEEGINNLQMTTNDNKLLSFFNLNCGISQIFLGNKENSLSYFQKAIQHNPSIVIAYNIVLYHFIFSPISDLKYSYINMLNESNILDCKGYEKSEQLNLIISASCFVLIKDNELHEFVIEQLKKSKYFEVINEFEKIFSDEKSKEFHTKNLSFFYFVETNFLNPNQFKPIKFNMNEYESNVLVKKGKSLLSNNQENEAIKIFQKAVSIYPDNYEALYNLSLAYESIELYSNAIEILLELDKNGLKDIEVLIKLSNCYGKIGDINKEISYIHEILNINPCDSKLWRHLGSIWEHLGNEKQCVICYIECISLDQSETELISWIETNCIHKNKCEELISLIQKQFDHYPNNPILFMLVALCYEKTKKELKAIEAYEKAIQIDPSNKKCLSKLINLTNEMKLFQKNEYYKRIYGQE